MLDLSITMQYFVMLLPSREIGDNFTTTSAKVVELPPHIKPHILMN